MPRTLSDEDCDAIVQKLFERILGCLEANRQKGPGIIPGDPITPNSERGPQPDSISANKPTSKLAYSKKELGELLGISPVTIWRLEMRGFIHSVPGMRHKIYSQREVDRFLKASSSDSNLTLTKRRAKRP